MMKSKIKINITGQKEYLYSTRQITQIIDIISEKHYKNEIINEIANSDKIKISLFYLNQQRLIKNIKI